MLLLPFGVIYAVLELIILDTEFVSLIDLLALINLVDVLLIVFNLLLSNAPDPPSYLC